MIPGNIDTILPCESRTMIMGKLVRYFHFAQIVHLNRWTDFSVEIISDAFENKVFPILTSKRPIALTSLWKSTIQRHRMIYNALSEQFAQGLHALSLSTKTKAEIMSTFSS